jgi:hypothetical protein
MTTQLNVEVGDRVEGGAPGTEDHDTGRVVEVDGSQVTVAWDSGVTTTQHARALRAKQEATTTQIHVTRVDNGGGIYGHTTDYCDEAGCLGTERYFPYAAPGAAVGDVTDDRRFLVDGVAALVGDDGTGDLGVIVRQALIDDPSATAGGIAEIVREARAEARIERGRA